MKRKIRLFASILSFLMLMSSFQFMSSAEISDTLSQQSEIQGAAADVNPSQGGETPTTSAIDSTVTSNDAIIMTVPSITQTAINGLSDVTVTTDSPIASNVSEAATSLLDPQRAIASVLDTTSLETIDTENGIPVITDTEVGSRIFPANAPEDIWVAFTGYNLQKLINDNTIRFELVDSSSPTSIVAFHQEKNSHGEDMMIGGNDNLVWMNMEPTDLENGIPAGTYTLKLASGNADIRLENKSMIQVTADPAVEIDGRNNFIGSLQKNNGSVEYILLAEMFNVKTNDIQASLVNSSGQELIQADDIGTWPIDKVKKTYQVYAHFTMMPSITTDLRLQIKYKDAGGNYTIINNSITPIRPVEDEIIYRMAGEKPNVLKGAPYTLSVNGWNLDTAATYTAIVYKDYDQFGSRKVVEMTAKPTNSTRLDFTCPEKLLGKYRLEVSRTDNKNVLNTFDIETWQPNMSVNAPQNLTEMAISGGKYGIGFDVKVTLDAFDFNPAVSAGKVKIKLDGKNTAESYESSNISVDSTTNSAVIAHFDGIMAGDYKVEIIIDGVELGGDHINVTSYQNRPYISKIDPAVISSSEKYLYANLSGYQLNRLKNSQGYVEAYLVKLGQNGTTTTVCGIELNNDKNPNYWLSDDGKDMGMGFSSNSNFEPGKYRIVFNGVDWNSDISWRVSDIIVKDTVYIITNTNCSKDLDLINTRYISLGQSDYSIYFSGINAKSLTDQTIGVELIDPQTNVLLATSSGIDLGIDKNNPDNWFLITANFTTSINKLYDSLKVKIGYLGQDGRIATVFDGCDNIKLGVTDKPFIYKTNQNNLPDITLKGYNLNQQKNYSAVIGLENNEKAYFGLNPTDNNTIAFRLDKSDYLQMNPGNNYRITLYDNDDKEIGTYRIHIPEIQTRFDNVTPSGIFAETNSTGAEVKVKLHFTEPLTEQSLNQLWFELRGENNDKYYKYDVNYKEGDTSIIIDPDDKTLHTAIAVINNVSAGDYKFNAGIRDLDQREIHFTVQTKDELPVILVAWNWATRANNNDAWLGFEGLNLDKLRTSPDSIGIDLVKIDGNTETVVATCTDRSWISDDGRHMNLNFKLRDGMTFSSGEYKIRPNKNWMSYSYQYRINNTIFTDNVFLKGLKSDEVGVGKSGYTLTVDGDNLNLLDPKNKNYEFRLYKQNDSGFDAQPYEVAAVQPDAMIYDDNGNGTISAVFSKSMPNENENFRLEIGYVEGSNFVKLPYDQKHPYNVRSVDYPTVTGFMLDSYAPRGSYEAHFSGWNLRGTAEVTVTKDDNSFSKTWSNIQVKDECGFDLEMDFGNDILTAGGYKVYVELNNDGNILGNWNYDFNINDPYVIGFEGEPQSGDWVLGENTTVGAIGQNLQFRLLTKNMEGNINLDGSQVMLEGDGTDLNYFASLTTEGGIVVADFNGVQPGRYRLKARINAYNQDYGRDRENIIVNSFQGKAAVTGSSSWAIAASAGKKDFYINYYGVNLNTLKNSIDNNAVAGKLVNIDTGAEIQADSNASWVHNDNNMEFNFHVAALPAGQYRLEVSSPNWDNSYYRIPNLVVEDKTFATNSVYPQVLGAGINNYRVQAEIENLDAMGSSAGKLEFRLLNTEGNPNFFAAADAILPTDGSNRVYADFTQTLPIWDQYMKLQIGNVINGTFTAIPGGEKIIRVVDWPYLYDAAATRADDSYQVYNLNIKGWNLPDEAKLEISHWDGEDRIIDIEAKQISILTATSISTQLDFGKKITGDNWYKCTLTYIRNDGQTDSRDIDFKVEGMKVGVAFEGAPASGDWVFTETAESGTTGAGIKINVLTENINSIDLGSSKVWLEGRDDFRGYYEAKLKVSGSSIVADFPGVQPGRYELKAQIKGDGKDYWINQYPIAVDSYQNKTAIVFANNWAIPESTDKMEFNINYDGYKLNSLADGSGKVNAKLVNTVIGAEVISDGCDFWNDGNSMSLHFTAPNGMAAGFYKLEISSQNWDASTSYRVENNFEVKNDTFVPGWKYPDKLGVNISNYTITAGIDNLDKWDNTEKKLVFRLMFNDANGNPTIVEQADAILEGDNRASASFNQTLPAQNQDVFLQIGWYTDNNSSKDFNSLPGGWLNIPVVDYPHVYDLKPNTLQSVQNYTINISGWNLAGHNLKLTVTGNGINKIMTTNAASNNIALAVDFGTVLTPGAYNFKLDCEQDGSYKQLCDRNYNIESGNQRVVTTVEVNGDSKIVLSGQTFSYNAVAKDQFNDIMENEEINWQLIGNPSGISISASGLLSFADTVTNGTVTIRATSRTSSNIYGEKTVSFSRNASQIIIGSVTGFHGKTVEVPVSIYGIEGVDAATINIVYDPSKIKYVGVIKGASNKISSVNVTESTTGNLDISIPTNSTLNGDENLFTLRFEIVGTNPSVDYKQTASFVSTSVNINYAVLDHGRNGEEISGYTITNGQVAIKMFGDVDGNGKITSNDATLIIRYLNSDLILNDQEKVSADVNGDGRITGSDLTLVLRRAVSVDSKLFIE